MKKLSNFADTVILGCDPEFFFQEKGKIIGAEKILPEQGLKLNEFEKKPQVIIDGVQVEINPRAQTCRQYLAREINSCLQLLKKQLKNKPNVKLDFSTTIEITKEELDTLKPSSKVFGCAPSKSTKKNTIKIADASKYMNRSAGGHVHIGHNEYKPLKDLMLKEPKRFIDMYDMLVGNTCVLLDRDPGNKERRKNYGRAGEYRTPEHGLEYRTLSNFWLLSYPLMSFVMSMMRMATNLVLNSTKENNYEEMIKKAVPMRSISTAINSNNYNIALKNFIKISKVLTEILPDGKVGQMYSAPPLTKETLPAFMNFIKKDIKEWFPGNPIDNWYNATNIAGQFNGWEMYMALTLYPLEEKERKTKKTTTAKKLVTID